MGFSISWIAFHGPTKAEVLSRVGLVDTEDRDEANESPVSGSELPGGWYVLFLSDVAHPYLSAESLQGLSKGCTVLGCQVEEHVMVSASFLYENGARIWHVLHENEKGVYNLEIEGDPPGAFSIDELRKKQDEAGGQSADVDYIFDAPVELAQRICGFRHDRWKFDWGQPVFTRLATPNA